MERGLEVCLRFAFIFATLLVDFTVVLFSGGERGFFFDKNIVLHCGVNCVFPQMMIKQCDTECQKKIPHCVV